jgi:hypothetical protein
VNSPEKSWQKLVAAARKAPREGDASAPFGFSARVAALAFEKSDPSPSVFALLSLRAAAVACALALAAVALNYSAIKGAFDDEPSLASNDDPIGEVVDMGS